jgi:uncharacterized protein YbjT (DUF2867 family)
MAQRIALIAGATGLVGRQCLPLLLERYERVVALGRRAALPAHERLAEHVVDFERLAEHAELLRGDDLFCCLGTTIKAAGSQEAFRRVDHDYVVELARLASGKDVRRFFLVSALGADAGSRVFYNRVKGETEDALRQLPFFAVHIVRPSLLLGDRDESRPAERLGQVFGRLAGPLFIGPLAPYRAIPAADVAATLVACADSDATGVHIHHPKPR